jgi:hypothetical protein
MSNQNKSSTVSSSIDAISSCSSSTVNAAQFQLDVMSKLSCLAPHMPASKLLQFAQQFTIEALQSQQDGAAIELTNNLSSDDAATSNSQIINQSQLAAANQSQSSASQSIESVPSDDSDSSDDQPGSHIAAVTKSKLCTLQSNNNPSQSLVPFMHDTNNSQSIANSSNRKRPRDESINSNSSNQSINDNNNNINNNNLNASSNRCKNCGFSTENPSNLTRWKTKLAELRNDDVVKSKNKIRLLLKRISKAEMKIKQQQQQQPQT